MCDDDKYNDDPAVRSGLHLFSLFFFFATEEGPFGAEMICQVKLSTTCLTLKIQQILYVYYLQCVDGVNVLESYSSTVYLSGFTVRTYVSWLICITV